MTDQMTPIPFSKLLSWITEEYKSKKSVFGIPESKFFHTKSSKSFQLFDEKYSVPVGPAAGPHTQLAQNIIAAYLTGARFFELKTVQILDTLEIEKPCIDAEDEAYNTEWSSEYTVPKAFDEYLKAWILLYYLNHKFFNNEERDFIFNMSVGYDLKGIKSEKINTYIENLKNAEHHPLFKKYLAELPEEISKNISPNISSSLTLSTMHGCPPEEIEAICSYIITEKELNTFVKLNPTLLGYEKVRNILNNSGYDYIEISEKSFSNDLQFGDAVAMIKRLQNLAASNGKKFGVKLSNTLGVKNNKNNLPGDEMYMSGKALFPLTINLAAKLAKEIGDNLKISYSSGVTIFNISDILNSGISPITLATDLLKPGGYYRFNQLVDKSINADIPEKLNIKKINFCAENSLTNPLYSKQKKSKVKISDKLPLFDCYIAPCVVNCPIHQDIPQYIKLVERKRYSEAYELIISKNPLPFITGHICDHPCMEKCTRIDYDCPVLIREIKLVAAEKGEIPLTPFKKGGINTLTHRHSPVSAFKKEGLLKVAVIGAGPCGLSAAYFLSKAGFDVTVFDKSKKPGGTVQNIIPGFRLPQSAIDADIKLIKSAGVKFELGSPTFLKGAGGISTPPFVRGAGGFKYFVVAIGAGKSIELKLEGDNKNVIGAIDFLKQLKQEKNLKFNPGENVVIVGGGNSAMDAARAAIRMPGVKNVSIVYRRTEKQMPADREELDAAKEDGVIFNQLLQPIAFDNEIPLTPFKKGGINTLTHQHSPVSAFKKVGINTIEPGILKCQKMQLGEPDASGRKRPVPIENEFVTLNCDSLICAIGERVDKVFLKNFGIIGEDGKIDSIQTKMENIFIGGDALSGPASVVEAISDGRAIADAILKKENLKYENDYIYKLAYSEDELLESKGKIKSVQSENLPQETKRCLACDFICDKCVEVCPNRANISIKVPGFKNISQIIHIDGMCNECGNCETFCPYDSAPYREKFTLFWSEEDFLKSSADGFFVKKVNCEHKIILRLNNKSFPLDIDRNGEIKKVTDNVDIKKATLIISSVINCYNFLSIE